jgi:SAM-dependent methyltransferase
VTTTTTYEEWARAHHGPAFLRRTAEANAAFLLPTLTPGQRLLDVGCGPGAITQGLAARVAPGEVVGVDRDEAFLDLARTTWTAPNLRFERADAADLPFDDDAFDVAFLHAVLQHVDSPTGVLREVRRVVRPGGAVAVADADLDAFLLHPRSAGLDAATALDRRTRRHPDVGRQLAALLLEAGFGSVEFQTTTSVVAGADRAAAMAASNGMRLTAQPFVDRAVSEGWVGGGGELHEMADAWRDWGAAPGAVFVTFWCQALGR